MVKTKSILVLLLFCIALILPASAGVNATKFSVSELGFTGPQTIQIYADGNLAGTYNTTSDAIPLPDHDFLIVIKPEIKNQNIGDMLGSALLWLTQYWYAVIFAGGIVVLFLRKW